MDPSAREKFIKIFNKYPCLWDKSSSDFLQFQKNAIYRNQIWLEVSKNFIEEGINVSEDLLRKTWTHMRNYFIRYKLPFTASKNLAAVNHEKALHETLNNMSQTVLASQVEIKQEVLSQMDIEPTIETEVATITLEMKYVPRPPVNQPVPAPAPVKYSPSAPIMTDTASSSRKRSLPQVKGHTEPTNFVRPVSTKSIQTQTEPDYLIQNPCIKRLPSLEELHSLRVTFSSKNTHRIIQLERNDEAGTQYDEVYTEPMEMGVPPPLPQHSFIFPEDSYVLQSL